MSRDATDTLRRLSAVLDGTVDLASELKATYLLNPAVGSKADTERGEGFRAGRYRPLVEAYSMSESRLVASGSHLKAVAVLLAQDVPEMGHAIAALARVALESATRVAWLLDPAIDGRVRGLRGLAELMYTFSEEAKIPVPLFRDKGKALFDELVVGAQALGLEPVRNSSGDVMHFGERRPGATEVIEGEVGFDGELVYRELSGVAHGNPTAHYRMTEPVPAGEELGITLREPGMSITRPAPLTRFIKPLAHVWSAYNAALGRKVLLYGWDRVRYQAWMVEASRELEDLQQRAAPGPAEPIPPHVGGARE